MIIMYEFWDSQMTTSDLKSTVNSPTLWLITRGILGQYISKDSIWMFYVTSDGTRTDHRGWKLNTAYTPWFSIFVEVTTENVEVTCRFYFEPYLIRNEIFTKWPVIVIKHHEKDWRPGYYDAFGEVEPKSNFSPFLTLKMTILVKVSVPMKCRPQ